MLFADRLEITNPGRLPDSLTFDSLRHAHASVPHNPLIAEPMYLTQYIERMGTGTGDMIRLCQEAGLPEPTFSYRDGFILTIARPSTEKAKDLAVDSSETSGKTEGKILELLRKYPEITIPEIAKKMARAERTVERLLRKLREQEIIGHIGPAKGGHWEVLQ